MPAFHTTTVENLVLLNACAVKKEKKKRERKNARWKKRFVVNLEERISRRVSFFLRLIVTRDYAWLGREFRKGSSLLSLYFIFVSRDSLQSNFSFSLHLLFLFFFSFLSCLFFSFLSFFHSSATNHKSSGVIKTMAAFIRFPFSGGFVVLARPLFITHLA